LKVTLKIHKYIVFLFFSSLFFENIDLFNLGIDFLATKITLVLLFISSLINHKIFLNLVAFYKSLKWLFLYFIILTIISFLNVSRNFKDFLDIPFLLNIILLVILICSESVIKGLLYKSLLVAAIVNFIIVLAYLNNYEVSYLDNRISLFGMNQNYLGVISSVSLLVLISFIQNKNNNKFLRLLYLLFIPFIFYLIILTGSRTAMISLFLGVLVFFITSLDIEKVLIRLLFFMPLLAFILYVTLENTLILNRLFDTVEKGDLSSRDLIWIDLLEVINNNFLFGIGKTGYLNVVGEGSPHNVIMEVICYTGIFGLFFFVLFLYRIINSGFKKINSSYNNIKLILLLALIGLLLSGQWFDQKLVWSYIAYIISADFVLKKNNAVRKKVFTALR